MRARLIIPLIYLLFPVALAAQPQIYNFSRLQEFLPKASYAGYVLGKPTGETSSMMGFSTSWAQMTYWSDSASIPGSISIRITDMLKIPIYMSATGNVDKETETGYERTVYYNGIRVLETFDSTSATGKLQFPVAGRFFIEASGSGIQDTRILYALLDSTDIAGLEELGRSTESH